MTTITAKFAWVLETMDPDMPEFLLYLREHNIAMLSTGVVHCCAGGGEDMEFLAMDRVTLENMYRDMWSPDPDADDFADIRQL